MQYIVARKSSSLATATHVVTNQARLWRGNALKSDPIVSASLKAFGASASADLSDFATWTGSESTAHLARDANSNPPRLERWNRYGEEEPVAHFHPSYHELMGKMISSKVPTYNWEKYSKGEINGSGAHRAALAYFAYQAESGTSCPMTMTGASVQPLLKSASSAEIGSDRRAYLKSWLSGIFNASYDPQDAPISEKSGVTLGMSMTEKTGGSDVRSNTTTAVPYVDQPYFEASSPDAPGTPYLLRGHKWFTSAPMSDGFLTLAYTDVPGDSSDKKGPGISCFLVPRWLPDGKRNGGLRFMRLKDKCGDKSNASSEVEYDNAVGFLLSTPGKGISYIMDMVVNTRLDCAVGSAALMAQAVRGATFHTSQRTAFGKHLVDQPAMQSLLGDLLADVHAATALGFYAASLQDVCGHEIQDMSQQVYSDVPDATRGAIDTEEVEILQGVRRLVTAVSKFWICKMATPVVTEAMEIYGGNGYVEEWEVPRWFRQSPLNGIWEGSGNVMVLDVLRTLQKDPKSIVHLLKLAHTMDCPRLQEHAKKTEKFLRSVTPAEMQFYGRHLVEHIALLVQGIAQMQVLPHSPELQTSYAYWSKARFGDDTANASYSARKGSLFGSVPMSNDMELIRQIVSNSKNAVEDAYIA